MDTSKNSTCHRNRNESICIDSPIGPIYLVATEQGLSGVFFKKQKVPTTGTGAAIKHLAQAAKELGEYFAGKRKAFTVPLDLKSGTDFQKRVWRALVTIPYGETRAYRDIAKQIKNEKAMRAVGSANGQNPLCIIVPCHRVIAADGTLGGYSRGLAIKRKLLALEGARLD